MHDAIRKPGKEVENRVLVSGEDVGKICAVEHVLEGGKYAHPDVWSIIVRDKSTEKKVISLRVRPRGGDGGRGH